MSLVASIWNTAQKLFHNNLCEAKDLFPPVQVPRHLQSGTNWRPPSKLHAAYKNKLRAPYLLKIIVESVAWHFTHNLLVNIAGGINILD